MVEPVVEEVTVDSSLDITAFTARENLTMIAEPNEEREQEWQTKYDQQTEKIQSLRYQVTQLQSALKDEKTSAH